MVETFITYSPSFPMPAGNGPNNEFASRPSRGVWLRPRSVHRISRGPEGEMRRLKFTWAAFRIARRCSLKPPDQSPNDVSRALNVPSDIWPNWVDPHLPFAQRN